jgi:hypothetical protein
MRHEDNYIFAFDLLKSLDALLEQGIDRVRLVGSQKHGDATAESPEGKLDLINVAADIRNALERAIQLDCFIKVNREINTPND